jgi:hypothetical protein
MGEVRVWKGERTEAQIRNNLFKKLTGKEEDLVALFKEAGQKWPDAMQYGRRVLTATFDGRARDPPGPFTGR